MKPTLVEAHPVFELLCPILATATKSEKSLNISNYHFGFENTIKALKIAVIKTTFIAIHFVGTEIHDVLNNVIYFCCHSFFEVN